MKKSKKKSTKSSKKKKTREDGAKKLYRSKQDKVIAGVCGGIAEHFAIDPIWVRLVALLLVFADGVGVILYILAWVLIPENPNQKGTKKTNAEKVVHDIKTGKISKKQLRKQPSMLGIIIVLLGIGLLMENIFGWFSFNYVWPVILIVVGALILRGKNDE